MSATYIGAELRRQVVNRAKNICEYCLIHEDDTFFGCHVDHIISEKHGGLTVESNLALACAVCNLRKGSDIASLTSDGFLTRLYHPRTDVWTEHFALSGALIEPLTAIGEVTVSLLQLNVSERILERQELRETERYPSEAALELHKHKNRAGRDHLTVELQLRRGSPRAAPTFALADAGERWASSQAKLDSLALTRFIDSSI